MSLITRVYGINYLLILQFGGHLNPLINPFCFYHTVKLPFSSYKFNPLNADDMFTCHATLATCYQLAQCSHASVGLAQPAPTSITLLLVPSYVFGVLLT